MTRPFAAPTAGLVLGLLLAACSSRSGHPPLREAQVSPHEQEKNEISQLASDIRQWRIEMGLRSEPDQTLIPSARYRPLTELRTICPADPDPSTPACRDTCNIADAICSNAEQICRIADKLGRDPWADEKCESAKASCKEATERCCECVAREEREAEREAEPEPAGAGD